MCTDTLIHHVAQPKFPSVGTFYAGIVRLHFFIFEATEKEGGIVCQPYALSTEHATVSSLSAVNGSTTAVISWEVTTLPLLLFGCNESTCTHTRHEAPRAGELIHGTRRDKGISIGNPRFATTKTQSTGPWRALSGLDQASSPRQSGVPRGGFLNYSRTSIIRNNWDQTSSGYRIFRLIKQSLISTRKAYPMFYNFFFLLQ